MVPPPPLPAYLANPSHEGCGSSRRAGTTQRCCKPTFKNNFTKQIHPQTDCAPLEDPCLVAERKVLMDAPGRQPSHCTRVSRGRPNPNPSGDATTEKWRGPGKRKESRIIPRRAIIR